MLAEGGGIDVPQWLSPAATVLIVGGFFLLSIRRKRKKA
jgi:hypothetical protein